MQRRLRLARAEATAALEADSSMPSLLFGGRRWMVGDLVDTLFRGNRTALVSHLVDEGDITPDELALLRRLLDNADNDSDGGA